MHTANVRVTRPGKLFLIGLLGFLGLIAGTLVALPYLFADNLRQRVIHGLESKFKSDVEIADLRVRIFPAVRVEGTQVVFRHKGRTDVPPLFTIRHFRAEASIPGLLMQHLSEVQLDGLRVSVPRDRKGDSEQSSEGSNHSDQKSSSGPGLGVLVDRVIADGAYVQVLPKDPGKEPLGFPLAQLRMHGVSRNKPMHFVSLLHNPKPPGTLHTTGDFGPWNAERPRLTPVSGSYSFDSADLSHFHGLKGTLSSKGDYTGVLERIAVKGYTDTPDFQVTGFPVHLKTDFEAVVDGTDGDTYLKPVIARFGNSTVVANGKIAQIEGRKGRSVILDVDVRDAKIEDMIRMAAQIKPSPVEGKIQFQTRFDLPPGDVDVVDKLRLDGSFHVFGSKFSCRMVEQKVAELSRKARGKPEATTPTKVTSDFEGNFHLRDGAVHFSYLDFAVPGAQVVLSGDYSLNEESIDMQGNLLMEAKVSETTTGVKSVLLKVVDPFFNKKGGGSNIPIKIEGTTSHPSFGLALGKK